MSLELDGSTTRALTGTSGMAFRPEPEAGAQPAPPPLRLVFFHTCVVYPNPPSATYAVLRLFGSITVRATKCAGSEPVTSVSVEDPVVVAKTLPLARPTILTLSF